MASERVQTDDPAGNPSAEPPGFPLPSLRQFLLPDSLVFVQCFRAKTVNELVEIVNAWVKSTKSIIATVSSPVVDADGVTLSLTYVSANGGPQNG